MAFTSIVLTVKVVGNWPRCMALLLVLNLNWMRNGIILLLNRLNLFLSNDGRSIIDLLALRPHRRLVEWVTSIRQLTALSNLVLVGRSL